jgi:hypothetical protein
LNTAAEAVCYLSVKLFELFKWFKISAGLTLFIHIHKFWTILFATLLRNGTVTILNEKKCAPPSRFPKNTKPSPIESDSIDYSDSHFAEMPFGTGPRIRIRFQRDHRAVRSSFLRTSGLSSAESQDLRTNYFCGVRCFRCCPPQQHFQFLGISWSVTEDDTEDLPIFQESVDQIDPKTRLYRRPIRIDIMEWPWSIWIVPLKSCWVLPGIAHNSLKTCLKWLR